MGKSTAPDNLLLPDQTISGQDFMDMQVGGVYLSCHLYWSNINAVWIKPCYIRDLPRKVRVVVKRCGCRGHTSRGGVGQCT